MRHYNWSKKQRRAYHRLRSGIYFHKEEWMRFLTLTSAPDMKRSLEDSWLLLHKRMIRVKPIDLVNGGYMNRVNAHLKYSINDEDEFNEPLSYFEYFKVKTCEGASGVYHILYFGNYYPLRWLNEQWKDITGTAYMIDIKEIKDEINDVERLSKYCVEQYVAGQSKFVSFSTSKNWCFPGYIDVWNNLKCRYTYIRETPLIYKINGRDIEITKWFDKEACVYGFESYIDFYAGRGVGQLILEDFGFNYDWTQYDTEKRAPLPVVFTSYREKNGKRIEKYGIKRNKKECG